MADSKYTIQKFGLTLQGDTNSITKGTLWSMTLSTENTTSDGHSVDGITYSLQNFKLSKEMYSSNCLEIVLQATGSDATPPNIADLKKFIGVKASLIEYYKAGDDAQSHQSAKDYLVFRCIPSMKGDDKKEAYVKLICYSLDKILDLKKYNDCYVAQRFGQNIFYHNTLNRHKEFKDGKLDLKIQHLTFSSTDPKDDSKTVSVEYVQPYLVQYEETYYSFLRRIANRCGEFLYFEDDQLHLGLTCTDNEQKNAISIDNYAEMSFLDNYAEGEEKFVEFSLNGKFPNTTEQTPRSYVGPTNDYNFLYSKDYTTKKVGNAEFDYYAKWAIGNTSGWLNQNNFADMLITAGKDIGTAVAFREIDVLNDKTKFNTKNFVDYDDPTKDCNVSTPSISKTNSNFHSLVEGKVTPFSLYGHPLQPKYFISMYNLGKKTAEETITVTLDNKHYYPLALGEKVLIAKKPYAITKLETVLYTQKVEVTTTDKDKDGKETTTTTTELVYKTTFDVIPLVSGEGNAQSFYPVPFKEGTICHSDPQVAKIDSNSDPQSFGRVQILYPWQNTKKNLSSEKTALETRKKTIDDKESNLNSRNALMKKANLTDAEKTKLDKLKKDTHVQDLEDLKKHSAELDALKKDPTYSTLKDRQEKSDKKKALEDKKISLEKKKEDLAKENEKLKDSTTKKDTAQVSKNKKNIAKYEKAIADIEASLVQYQSVTTLSDAEKKTLKDKETAIKNKEEEVSKDNEKCKGWATKEDGTLPDSEVAEREAINKRLEVLNNALEFRSVDTWSSPWIKVSTPFSSSGTSMRFTPQVGDIVLVGYRNGNIEDPYIINSIASGSNAGGLSGTSDGVIGTPNGHSITISNPSSGAGFISSMVPANKILKALSPNYLEMSKWGRKGTDDSNNSYDYEMGTVLQGAKPLTGGITMSDKYGFYTLSLSTDRRAIDIKSPMGTVSINALTGITISAPNGNVKIEGQNVEITAGNSVKITSGTNIKDKQLLPKGKSPSEKAKSAGISALNAVTTTIAKQVKLVDLTLLRCVMDGLLKPIGGTMLIKSNHFLHLEAGKGETQLPINYDGNFFANQDQFKNKLNKRTAEAGFAVGLAEKVLNEVVGTWNSFYDRIDNVSSIISGFSTLNSTLRIKVGTGDHDKLTPAVFADWLLDGCSSLTADKPTDPSITLDGLFKSLTIGNANKFKDTLGKAFVLNRLKNGVDVEVKAEDQDYKAFHSKIEQAKTAFRSFYNQAENALCFDLGSPISKPLVDDLAKNSEHHFMSNLVEYNKFKSDLLAILQDAAAKSITQNRTSLENLAKLSPDILITIKRQFFYYFLKKYQEENKSWFAFDAKPNVFKKAAALQFSPTMSAFSIKQDVSVVNNDDDFETFVNAFHVKPADSFAKDLFTSTLSSGMEGIGGVFSKTGDDTSERNERYCWQGELPKGKILMSDQKGCTYNIDGTSFKQNTNDLLKSALSRIAGIKKQ